MRLFTAVLLSVLCVNPAYSATETITIVADRWCPYNCEPDSPKPGFMIEIAKKAFARHNIEIAYSIMPWSRAIESVRKYKYTAIIGAAHDDAPDFVFPKIPQGWMRNAFYVKKGSSWRFEGIDSLNDISLGAISDYSYNLALDGYIAQYKKDPRHLQLISGDDALAINVKKLLAGRIGALVEGEYVMSYYIMRSGLNGEIIKAGSLASTDADYLYIAFSPQEPNAKKYAEIIAEETENLRKTGELKKILQSYGVSDWKK